MDNIRREAAAPLAKQLTEQVKPLALPEARFEFKFEPLEQPNAEGLSFIQLYLLPIKAYLLNHWHV